MGDHNVRIKLLHPDVEGFQIRARGMITVNWLLEKLLSLLPEILGLIVLASLALASCVTKYCAEALKTPGPDMRRLMGLLRRGGEWRWRYVRMLRIALDRVDQFFNDAGRPGLACRWVTGGGAWPCWTARSFDKCALIGVVYPFLALFLTWVVTGDAGDLGEVLGMPVGYPGR